MTPEIERLAKEAGISDAVAMSLEDFNGGLLSKFAALISEECAKACETMPYSQARENSSGSAYIHVMSPKDGAQAIRAKFALSGGEVK